MLLLSVREDVRAVGVSSRRSLSGRTSVPFSVRLDVREDVHRPRRRHGARGFMICIAPPQSVRDKLVLPN